MEAFGKEYLQLAEDVRDNIRRAQSDTESERELDGSDGDEQSSRGSLADVLGAPSSRIEIT